MSLLASKFAALSTDNAPGQEVRQSHEDIRSLMIGEVLPGRRVDFSHGDVDAFAPPPDAMGRFEEAVRIGGRQAYTEYRGSADIRAELAAKLEAFTGAPVSKDAGIIVTPGTQGALFLAVAATVAAGDKVAIVQPDYFANRKLVRFFGGEIVPIAMDYLGSAEGAGLDLTQLEAAFEAGAKTFVFSNPNNPTGAVYSPREIERIAALAKRHGATIVADQLYSRLQYDGESYTHIRANGLPEDQCLTIMGPSKTESLSGYRLGVAFGAPAIIDRMEKLQAIVSLRAAGYNQAVLRSWFDEPAGWMEQRVAEHQTIRDDLLAIFSAAGFPTRRPQAGSYVFPTLPRLTVAPLDFVRLLRHQADVIVTPGTEFGPHERSIRLNFSQDRIAALDAARRIVEMVERYRA
jgi:aspartate/methionine/tyrosine aminotransferase